MRTRNANDGPVLRKAQIPFKHHNTLSLSRHLIITSPFPSLQLPNPIPHHSPSSPSSISSTKAGVLLSFLLLGLRLLDLLTLLALSSGHNSLPSSVSLPSHSAPNPLAGVPNLASKFVLPRPLRLCPACANPAPLSRRVRRTDSAFPCKASKASSRASMPMYISRSTSARTAISVSSSRATGAPWEAGVG